MLTSKIMFLFVTFMSFPYCYNEPNVICPTERSAGALISKKDMALKGHVRKTLEKTTFIQCSLRCLKEDWCVSVNFEIQKTMGKCELNDYGVEDETGVSIEKGEFEKKDGFVYTQLRPAGLGCHDDTCLNGGTCVIDCIQWTPHVQCHCASGFRKNRCEDINECSSNPCLHGGTCTDQVNGYSCTCAAGYNGANCENNINECSSNPCQNGGTCTDQVNGYSCTCAAGYNGANCQNHINECSSNPCQSGGTCTDQVNGYSCTCTGAYSGTRCETLLSSSSNCELHFPSTSTSNSIVIDSALSAELGSFTVSFWIKVSHPTVILYPFSYATTNVTSAWFIGIKEDATAEITVAGETKSLSSGLRRDNTWQHCAITWRSSTGKVYFYLNSVLKGYGMGLKIGEKVPSGGKLVIGQYQGSYGGRYDSSKLMIGYLADLNIWSSELTSSEIKTLSSKCFSSSSSAPVLSWSTIISNPLGGELSKTCPATCPA